MPAATDVPSTKGLTVEEKAEPPWPTPYDVRPEIRDRDRASRIVVRHYPEDLRQAGIGGHAIHWVYVDAEGRVRRVRLLRSSGHPAIDSAAAEALKEVGSKVGYRPALRDGVPVPAWIPQSVTFSVRR